MTTTIAVHQADTADAETIAHLIAASLGDLDVCRWLIPHNTDRARILPSYYRIWVDHAFTHGQVLVTSDHPGNRSGANPSTSSNANAQASSSSSARSRSGSGANFGRISGAVIAFDSATEPDNYLERLTRACGRWTARARHLDDTAHRAHPADRGDHQYCAFFGVLPQSQNNGIGTALLRTWCDTLDDTGSGAYLEASNTDSHRFYARAGFRDCAPPLQLPYDGEQLRPMWRDPG